MDGKTANKLVALNKKFYKEFSVPFSSSRQHVQPGVRKILTTIDGTESILDLGCGNGELIRELEHSGFRGSYLGLDFSPDLFTKDENLSKGFPIEFREADLTTEVWGNGLDVNSFDLVVAFAVLHHIPGHDARLNILAQVYEMLAPTGRFCLSNWQFLNSEKFRKRIQDWSQVGLSSEQVDEGDFLLDWRSGGIGLRYIHLYSEEELRSLAAESGFIIEDKYYADGKTGDLGLYEVWSKA